MIKKSVCLFTIFFAFSCVVISQEVQKTDNTNNPNASEINFTQDTHDFGTIKQGGDGTWEFQFKNTGNEPLIISNAKGSCGCTVPTWSRDPIKKGESGVIKVSYDTKRVGMFTKTVTITSNAKTSTKVLTIKGTVEAIPQEPTVPFKKTDDGAMPFENPKAR